MRANAGPAEWLDRWTPTHGDFNQRPNEIDAGVPSVQRLDESRVDVDIAQTAFGQDRIRRQRAMPPKRSAQMGEVFADLWKRNALLMAGSSSRTLVDATAGVPCNELTFAEHGLNHDEGAFCFSLQ